MFPETRWSLVLNARENPNPAESQSALEEICKSYWYPLYSYLRRSGLSPHDAEDRTQGFFSNLLSKRSLDRVEQKNGKLRAYLLASIRNFNNAEWRQHLTQKRGGLAEHIAIDQDWAENRLAADPVQDDDHGKLFDRDWALMLLGSVFSRLENHYQQIGKTPLYEAIKGSIQGDGKYEAGAELAKQLQMTPEGIRSSVFKLRQRFSEYVKEEIAQTCLDEEEAAEEISYLCLVLTQIS